MKNIFSRRLIIRLGPSEVEYVTVNTKGTLTPNIEINKKGLVASVGRQDKLVPENQIVNVFTDTLDGMKAQALMLFLKHIVSHISMFIRPKVCMIVSKKFDQEFGGMATEYITLLLATSLSCEVFVFSDDMKPRFYFYLGNQRSGKSIEFLAMNEQQGARALLDFKDLIR